jgi:hypothetical protein
MRKEIEREEKGERLKKWGRRKSKERSEGEKSESEIKPNGLQYRIRYDTVSPYYFSIYIINVQFS